MRLEFFSNVRPKVAKEIPWGWVNTQSDWGPVATENPGRIFVPDLVEYFDWNTFEVTAGGALGSRDMKSIFQTASRFMGWERLLVEQPDLGAIGAAFHHWNEKLLRSSPIRIEYFIVGDDYGTNNGLMVSPQLWRTWIKPEVNKLVDLGHKYGCKVVMHSDGDVSEILGDFVEMGVDSLHPVQQVGGMVELAGARFYNGMYLMHDTEDMRTHDYRN